jgi:RimJ/RimL family protein N-acetyltransferase
VIIRQLEDGDFDAFKRVLEESISEYLQFLKQRDLKEYLQELEERKEADPSSLHHFVGTGSSFVAEEGGRAVGFVLAHVLPSMDGSKWLSIEYIVVQEEFRRQGIASALLRGLVDHAKKLGIDRVYATINPDNAPSINLHRKVGFEVLDWKVASCKVI